MSKYNNHEGLNLRTKDYCVHIEFGFHLVQGIEGIIGSSIQLDGSYISSSINIAFRLAAANQQFGTNILISGNLMRNLTKEGQNLLRQIGVVKVKGSIVPMELYTLDLYTKKFSRRFQLDDEKIISQVILKNFWISILKENCFLKENIEIQLSSGFNYYFKGEWNDAQKVFMKKLAMIQEQQDGPSKTLLQLINSFEGKPPKNQEGFSELPEK